MSDRETLLALATRCEQAPGPDRELDLAICRLAMSSEPLGHAAGISDDVWRGSGLDSLTAAIIPHYTASLDAALTLVPVGHALSLHVDADGTVHAGVMPDDGDGCDDARRCGATPALSLTVAALRARAAECAA